MAVEKVIINHFGHEHPLILTQNVEAVECFACLKPIVSESAYVCVENPYCIYKDRNFIHQRCAELPNQILHPSHPQHHLRLFQYQVENRMNGYWCDLCGYYHFAGEFRYRCHRCDFNIEITCKEIDIDELFGEKRVDHPRHPHPLKLMMKQAFSFSCDACGTQDADIAYSCGTCDFLIHKTCAFLPTLLTTNQHHHQLSLASCFPIQFRKYTYQCAICDEYLNMTYWIYYCGDCRYFVHLKCATSTAHTSKRGVLLDEDKNDGSDLIKFPLSDISSKLIRAFVMREKSTIPDVKDMSTTVKISETTASYSYLFNYHTHPLRWVSEVLMKEEDRDEDEDDELKICDLCVTPISSPPYYECAACKYFVHSICYLLPKTLSSSSSSSSSSSTFPYGGLCPKTFYKNHKFSLYTSSKEMDEDPDLYRCSVCEGPTNGMVYRCEECGMIIDVKCASLPTVITHASHLHPNLIMTIKSREGMRCHHCEYYMRNGYRCSKDGCDFALDFKCTLLPPTVRKPEWDHHPLVLTFDASADHPSDFFCDFCEEEMHPKKWMYHCRQCDNSYDPYYCLKTASGYYKNIKFGRRFELGGIHPHPLTFNYITLKKRCDICDYGVYTYLGFECESCYFVVCFNCGDEVIKNTCKNTG